jgi:hypothetical protein
MIPDFNVPEILVEGAELDASDEDRHTDGRGSTDGEGSVGERELRRSMRATVDFSSPGEHDSWWGMGVDGSGMGAGPYGHARSASQDRTTDASGRSRPSSRDGASPARSSTRTARRSTLRRSETRSPRRSMLSHRIPASPSGPIGRHRANSSSLGGQDLSDFIPSPGGALARADSDINFENERVGSGAVRTFMEESAWGESLRRSFTTRRESGQR